MSGRRWTPQEEERLKELALEHGMYASTIASRGLLPGRSENSISRKMSLLGLAALRKSSTDLPPIVQGGNEPALKPVHIDLPEVSEKPLDSVDIVSLHWSDPHFPFHDERVEQILYQFAQAVKPIELYAQGDFVDFWQISRFRPPLEQKLRPEQIDLNLSIQAAAKHLATMARESEATKRVFFAGNHEDRWDRLLGDIQRDGRLRQVLSLPHLQQAMSLPFVLGLKGWDYVPYLPHSEGEKPFLVVRDRLVLLHGWRSNKWVARSIVQDDFGGRNVMAGHAHVIQNWTQKDLNGTNSGWLIGCCCADPHWRSQPNWHRGFAVVTWKKTSNTWLFNVEQVRVHDNRALWRDKIFTA